MSVYDFSAPGLDGQALPLSSFQGKVLLIVNTATHCGFTPQYAGLQQLQDEFATRGFSVLAFPCNQFGGQAPGSGQDIQAFCQLRFANSFPQFDKVDVKGKEAHPLFLYLTSQQKGILGGSIKWNFTKFLVDQKGQPIKRYAPSTEPADIRRDIQDLLDIS